MTKARPICTWGQFAKLCESYARNIDLTKAQQLEIVEGQLVIERGFSDRGHWDYRLNRHLALVELRNALKAEMTREHEEVAA